MTMYDLALCFEPFNQDKELYSVHPLLAALAFKDQVDKRAVSLPDGSVNIVVDKYEKSRILDIAASSSKIIELLSRYPHRDATLYFEEKELRLSAAFSAKDYKILYPDMLELSDKDATEHYNKVGKNNEGRYGSVPTFIFDRLKTGNYLRPHSIDGMNALDLGPDFLGTNYSYANISESLSTSVDNSAYFCPHLQHPQRAILFHVFYPEEISNYIRVIESAVANCFALYVSTPIGMPRSRLMQLEKFNPSIVQVPNIGRDVLGFYSSFRLAMYSSLSTLKTVILIHTKKSPHVHEHYRRRWVKNMTEWLENTDLMAKCVADIETGISSLFAGSASRQTGYGQVPTSYFSRLPGSDKWPYASGTMVLVSADVLKSALLQFDFDDFKSSPTLTNSQHLCGGIPHAVERLISYEAMNQNGISWV